MNDRTDTKYVLLTICLFIIIMEFHQLLKYELKKYRSNTLYKIFKNKNK